MQIPILPSDVIREKMNPPTQHLIHFIETSPTHPVLNELPFILIEIYKIAIDMYTLSKELFWYFDSDVRLNIYYLYLINSNLQEIIRQNELY